MGIAQNPSGVGGLGYGQARKSVGRSSGVTYYNTTGRPIRVSFKGTCPSAYGQYDLVINGIWADGCQAMAASMTGAWGGVVGVGESYSLSAGVTGVTYSELS